MALLNFGDRITHRAEVVAGIAKTFDLTRGAEIGVKRGDTAARILELNRAIHLTCVDPWKPQPGHKGPEDWATWPHQQYERQARSRLLAFQRRVRIIKGMSDEAALKVDDGSLDFVFIDGDHSTLGVLIDVETWWDKLKPTGWFIGHDASWPTVRAAINQVLPGYETGPDDTWFRPKDNSP